MKLRGLALCVALSLAGSGSLAAEREPPKPGPVRPIRLPAVQKLSLSNGLPVLLAELHEVPVVHVRLVVRSGATADPLQQAGLASLTADLLDEAAGGEDALALANAMELLGAQLETGTGWDTSNVDLHVPVARLEAALALMAKVALRPDFPAEELERVRKERLTELLQARDDPGRVASVAFARAVYGTRHRYGLSAGGDAASLAALATGDLRSFHSTHYRPSQAALIVAGDVTPASVAPLFERFFGGWRSAAAGLERPVPEPAQLEERVLWLVDRPGSAQSAIRIGRVGPDRATPDHAALEVMNTLLGGAFTSRLNDNLREQHGYAYGAGSWFDYRRTAGLFSAVADVETDVTAPALGEFLKELERIRMPATPQEVERARNYLALSFAAEFETTRQIAGRLAEQWTYGLPADCFSGFVPGVLAAGVPEVRKAALARLDPKRLAIVVVGDRARIEAKLRALKLAPLKLVSIDDVMGPAPKAN